jgi:hypothetical protein
VKADGYAARSSRFATLTMPIVMTLSFAIALYSSPWEKGLGIFNPKA